MQALVVQPQTKLAPRKHPISSARIALTRQAFGLENLITQTFDPQANLTAETIRANDLTIRNVRL
ncbi:MAG: COG1615 family transporter, partial [Chamaesiphon sp. CSU_1_12]|nr:COG1615 family transporter [Chamaesiphon sp. CSU_1_12]